VVTLHNIVGHYPSPNINKIATTIVIARLVPIIKVSKFSISLLLIV
jgi:hypothetical protein